MADDVREGTRPAQVPEPTASDEDRQRVVTRLRDAAGEGFLGLDELEDRMGRAFAARTISELATLTGDLPVLVPARPVGRASRRRDIPAIRNDGFRSHLTVYVLVIGMLVGIWALGGFGHPWPFYPAAGWGIGLGSHYMAADQAQRRYERKRADRAQRAVAQPSDNGAPRLAALPAPAVRPLALISQG